MPKRYRQLWVNDFPKVPTWWLELNSNLRPSGRKTPNLPLSHHAPHTFIYMYIHPWISQMWYDYMHFVTFLVTAMCHRATSHHQRTVWQSYKRGRDKAWVLPFWPGIRGEEQDGQSDSADWKLPTAGNQSPESDSPRPWSPEGNWRLRFCSSKHFFLKCLRGKFQSMF